MEISKNRLIMHDSSFKDRHFNWALARRAKELLKLNNTINTCVRLNIILYHSLSRNICEILM